MSSKYVDPTAIMQVIGCVYNNPRLLDYTDKYTITDDDFPDTFHKTVFGCIYKLYELGSKKITLENISDFLDTRPKSQAIYKQQKGEEWLLKVSENANQLTFDYYYGRMKKMSLLLVICLLLLTSCVSQNGNGENINSSNFSSPDARYFAELFS